ncbi:hypothetical protein MKX01_009337 [Papaver californicum]|nr:hypothetical protein MKX01_009337 [Papaver californicum]
MKKGQDCPARPAPSCAACKYLKRKCIPNCVFAPYFKSDELHKFVKVHKVFGASNVSKILGEVPVDQREDSANSLVYEAEARLRDPVYGCIGALALLQNQMIQLKQDLAISRAYLACYASDSTPPPLQPTPPPPPPSPLISSDCYFVDGLLSSDDFVVYDPISVGSTSNPYYPADCQPHPYSGAAPLPAASFTYRHSSAPASFPQ